MFNDSPDPMTVEFLKDGTVKVDYNSFDMPCDQRSRFRVSLLHIHGHVGDKDLSEVGHANAIVFDQKYGQFLRFEPHANSDTGLGASDILNKKITSIVVGRLQAKYEEPITVLNISDTLPDILQRKEPVCVFMSLLFLEYVGIFSRDESCPSLRWLAKHIAGVLLSEQKTIKYMLWLRVSDERWL